MELGLAGKTALITGGTSGIGLADRAPPRRGGLQHRDLRPQARAKLDAALAELNFGKAKGLVADICKPDDVAALVGMSLKAFGRIDIVVSNAGTHLAGRIDEVATDDLSGTSTPRWSAPGSSPAASAPHMRRQGGGRFIVIIGQTGKVPQANAIASTIVNAAQHAFVKSLSDELAPSKILVNAVCPSRIKTPLTDGLTLYNEVYLGRSLEQQETRWGAEVPLGRWGTARGHRQCGRVPGVGPGRVHLRRQHRRRWRPPADDLLDRPRHDRDPPRLEELSQARCGRRGRARHQPDHRAARDRRGDRAERMRQVHPAQHDRRPLCADRAARSSTRVLPWRTSTPTSAT